MPCRMRNSISGLRPLDARNNPPFVPVSMGRGRKSPPVEHHRLGERHHVHRLAGYLSPQLPWSFGGKHPCNQMGVWCCPCAPGLDSGVLFLLSREGWFDMIVRGCIGCSGISGSLLISLLALYGLTSPS